VDEEEDEEVVVRLRVVGVCVEVGDCGGLTALLAAEVAAAVCCPRWRAPAGVCVESPVGMCMCALGQINETSI